MFPIRDDQPRFSTPYVNYFIIALNVLIYVFFEIPVQMQGGRHFEALIFQFGFVPEHLTGALAGAPHYSISASLLTIFTSMFLHGDLFHIIGNLWFLWIFGDNIEDYLGHFSYLIFYLLCGIAAALTFIAINPSSIVPTIGASGAIAGIMGAYILLYPRARVQTLVVLIVFITFWWLPAWVFLGYWFLIQFVATSVEAGAAAHHQTGGVAFAAHVGGFVAGLLMIKLFPKRTPTYRYGSW
ncbi:MAG: rhomboid family intramembrane serine protease [Acidobacteria bacterium]|nr:MAG: rhomboid family intramembrane serine protease [Acidobacteriota bacterium]